MQPQLGLLVLCALAAGVAGSHRAAHAAGGGMAPLPPPGVPLGVIRQTWGKKQLANTRWGEAAACSSAVVLDAAASPLQATLKEKARVIRSSCSVSAASGGEDALFSVRVPPNLTLTIGVKQAAASSSKFWYFQELRVGEACPGAASVSCSYHKGGAGAAPVRYTNRGATWTTAYFILDRYESAALHLEDGAAGAFTLDWSLPQNSCPADMYGPQYASGKACKACAAGSGTQGLRGATVVNDCKVAQAARSSAGAPRPAVVLQLTLVMVAGGGIPAIVCTGSGSCSRWRESVAVAVVTLSAAMIMVVGHDGVTGARRWPFT